MPDNIKQIIDAATGATPSGAWGAALVAVVLSALRILGDEHSKKWHRLALEMPTAGCIGYTTGVFVIEQGLGMGGAFVAATIVGHLGTEWVRNVARKIVNKQVEK